MKAPYPNCRQTDIVIQEFEDEVVIYDLRLNKAFVLNDTCAFVWRNCDGKKEVSEISKTLAQRSNQVINDDIVWLAIEQLKKENLLANAEEMKSGFEGLSRREVVKKIGLSTMIALPMISTLVAPLAANAASGTACVARFGTCAIVNFTQSDCCSGLRCDQVTPSTTVGACNNCFPTGGSFGGTGASVPACDALITKNLCCNPTGTPIIGGGFCGCP